MHSLPAHYGATHSIDRSNIFEDASHLFQKEDVLMEFPFQVQFVGEKAIDIGGVSCDMLSAYWEEVYKRFFDGLTLVTPAVHSHVDLSVLPTVGKILSHGYFVSGFFPVCIAFLTLACILLGPNCEVPPRILIDAFADSLCTFEVRIINDALQHASLAGVASFSDEMKIALINLPSRYGCREIPTSQFLKQKLFEVAKYEFHLKPLGAISARIVALLYANTPFGSSRRWKVCTRCTHHCL